MKVRLDRSRRDCERESEKKKESGKEVKKDKKGKKKKKERSREALERSGVPIRTAKRNVNSRFVRLRPGRRE